MKKNETKYEIQEILPGVHVVMEYNLTSMTIISGSKKALVLDTGNGVGDFLSIIKSIIGDLPFEVALTHGHVDHSGGRGQFSKIYMCERDKRVYKESTPLLRTLYLIGMKFTVPTIPFGKARIRNLPEPEVEYIDEGYVFDLGDRHVEAIALPGHTLGCLAYLIREDRAIIGGDSYNPGLFLFMHHATSVQGWIKTAEKLQSLHDRFDLFFPAHGFSPLAEESRLDLIECAKGIMKKHKRNCLFPIIVQRHYKGVSITYRLSHIYDKKKQK